MFKLKNENFYNREFLQGLHILANEKLPASVAWNISRIFRQSQKCEKDLREEVRKLAAQNFKKDDNGETFKPKLDENKVPVPGQFEELVEGGQKIFDDKVKEMMEIEVEMQSHKIKLSDLIDTKVSGSSLAALEAIVEE